MISGRRPGESNVTYCGWLYIFIAGGSGGYPSVVPLDVMIALCGRRLGDIDRVGARKSLLQPLLQGRIETALFTLFEVFGGFEVLSVSGSGHGCLSVATPIRAAIWRMAQPC